MQNSINSLEDIRKERQLREEIEDLHDKEELKWAQKARTNWILYGDRNTKYFKTIVKQRRATNRILQLKDGDGNFTDNLNEIKNILLSHFKSNYEDCSSRSVNNILKELQPLNIPTLTDEQHFSLNKPISDFEIECAVFQLGAHKAPGPDGIPTFFFHAFWDIVKEDVTRSVQAIFHLVSLFKPLNHSYIVLIPKKPFPDEVSHFRPISLCNVIYKVISKVMVNRLKPVMDSLITPYQNAFIQRINISGNILLSHEIMDTLKKKKWKKFSFEAIKIDISKAYDRVNWNFLKVDLTAMKFDPKWIRWIMECVFCVIHSSCQWEFNFNLSSNTGPKVGRSFISLSLSFVC